MYFSWWWCVELDVGMGPVVCVWWCLYVCLCDMASMNFCTVVSSTVPPFVPAPMLWLLGVLQT